MTRAENKVTGVGAQRKPGVVKLSDLAVEGREFDLNGTIYHTRSPIELTLPEIAKVDRMGKEVNQLLPAFGKGDYEGIDIESFQRTLTEMVTMISDVPEEVANKAIWWQQMLIIGLFQSVVGMDFLGEQLKKLGNLPEGAQTEIQEAFKQRVDEMKTKTSTSPTP